MNAIRIAATAASVFCLSIAYTWAADDPNALSTMREPVGQRAADHWTPAAMSAAKLSVLRVANPAAGISGGDGGTGVGGGGDGGGGIGVGGGGGGGTGGGSGNGGTGGTGTIGSPGTIGSGSGGGGTANQAMWAGKLYFTAPDGDYWCEAQFVSDNVVMTAAQCLQDGKTGDYFTNLRFVQELPGGQNNAFDVQCPATFKGWAQPNQDRWTYDIGMVLVKGHAPQGAVNVMWGYQSIDQSAFGYVTDKDSVKKVAGKLSGSNGIVQMTPTGGAEDMPTGAAWMTATQNDKGQLGTVFSLRSFTDPTMPGVYFGPYFDDKIKTIFDYTSNGCQ